ncbi:hypothetical protein OSB04_012605 [Centaurea solstitialis]|uniref:Uncharacterized protein n=1 Tax=Centaurea solstitialis TaxID=347529 RepID=A0AA38WQR6_9ASTR|nr:hypothetical protein OSB04_012605 [Centaurea solstitialis]
MGLLSRFGGTNGLGIFDWMWDSSRDLRGRAVEEITHLFSIFQTLHPLCWLLDEDGQYSVKKLKTLVEDFCLVSGGLYPKTHCNNLVPIKINIFIWYVLHDSVLFPSCEEASEILDHCIVRVSEPMARLNPGKIRAKACPFVNVHRLRMEGFEPTLGTMNPTKPYPLQYTIDRPIIEIVKMSISSGSEIGGCGWGEETDVSKTATEEQSFHNGVWSVQSLMK